MSASQNPSFVARKLKPTDAQAMAALHAACFAPEQQWQAASIRKQLEQPATHALGYLTADGLIGFIICNVAAGEAEILTLAVSPQHRRKKIASTLIKTFIAHAMPMHLEKIFLDVMETNIGAILMYEENGFTIISMRPNYYTVMIDGHPVKKNGIVMAKTF